MSKPSAVSNYEGFLVRNVSAISTIESSLRSLTWLLIGRFKDAELASESLSALLNLMSMYHDTLLTKVAANDPKYRPILPSTLHTRFTRAWADKDLVYKWVARALEIVRFTELMIEMGLKRKVSSQNRWRGVMFLESIKTMLRLVLLRLTRRPLLSPPLPEREFDPAMAPPSSSSNASSPTLAPTSPAYSPPATPEHLRNNHVSLPLNPLLTPPPPSACDTSVEDYLLPKALMSSTVRPNPSLLRSLVTPQDWLAETVYIIRPLVYVYLLKSDRKSNRPLIASLAMELLSRNLRRTPSGSSGLERQEYARRDRDIFWYLLRGSIWQQYTRPKVEGFADATARIPLIGILSSFVKDWTPLIDEYYYYTAS